MYVYKHTNGTYHFVPDVTVRSHGESMYFDSPNVKERWHFISDDKAKEFVENCKDKEQEFENRLEEINKQPKIERE